MQIINRSTLSKIVSLDRFIVNFFPMTVSPVIKPYPDHNPKHVDDGYHVFPSRVTQVNEPLFLRIEKILSS